MGTDTLFKYAAVDIGSNAVRLLLCNVVEDGQITHYNKSELIRIPLRLGEDAFTIGKISRERAKKLLKTLEAFKLHIDVFEPIAYRACATASLRASKNGLTLVSDIRSHCGLKVEIISGKEEAQLIYANHIEQQLERNAGFLYIDVGGGSTEITLFSRGECISSKSFDIGTLRLLHHSVSENHWEEMKEWVRACTNEYFISAAIGSGGNINKIHKLIGKRGHPLDYSALRSLYKELSTLTVDERVDKWELNPDRADVIVPAAKIFLAIMKSAKASSIIVPQIGLADGIVHDLHERSK